MASYSYKLRPNTDLCHFYPPTETDYGVQCLLLRENNNIRSVTVQYYNVAMQLFENRVGYSPKDFVFIQVASPNTKFGPFDAEKYKLIIVASAYFKVLEFFASEWTHVQKRIDADYGDLKANQEWISINPAISFRGPADIYYKQPLDSTNTFVLDLAVTKRIDSGKVTVSLNYSDPKLGCLSLPVGTMLQLAQDYAYLKSLYDYKEPIATKKSRQS
jgi:hypothetical protein